jgi:uncharacterized protein (DUF1800 family)
VLSRARHDDSPQDYLGRHGIHDLDGVIDAIVQHPACAPFITGKLVNAILGPGVDPGLVAGLAKDFAASGLQIRPLVRAILEAGLERGAAQPLAVAPVPWFVSMIKATTAPAKQSVATIGESGLVEAGQMPMDAPNVAGWPGGRNWLSASTTVARFNMAVGLSAITPATATARAAAAAGDDAKLADALGRPDGFSATTLAALAGARGSDTLGGSVLAVAMASPEVALA